MCLAYVDTERVPLGVAMFVLLEMVVAMVVAVVVAVAAVQDRLVAAVHYLVVVAVQYWLVALIRFPFPFVAAGIRFVPFADDLGDKVSTLGTGKGVFSCLVPISCF